MRIVSGKYKGFQINAPKNIPARPTTDRSKESLFNILDTRIELEGIKVLDLFSGTGNMAYEFASRGASQITAVDLNYHSVKFIQESFRRLKFENAKVIKSNAFAFLKKLEEQYDIIFADPPYALSDIHQLPELVFERNLLSEGGWFILEHAKQTKIQHPKLQDIREYGQSCFSIFH